MPSIRREVLPPRSVTSPVGAILLSTSTMLLAIAASTLLLRDHARTAEPAAPPGLFDPYALRSLSLRGGDEPPLLVRPALRCDAGRRSTPLTPPPVAQETLEAAEAR